MNPLLETYQFLERSCLNDPRLALAAAIAVYDPHPLDEEDVYDFEIDGADDDEILAHALRTLRHIYPDLYADSLSLRATGSTTAAVTQYIEHHLLEMGWEMIQLESLAQNYIPLYSLAIDHFNDGLSNEHAQYQELYLLLRADFPPTTGYQDDYVGEICAYLIHSIDQRPRSSELSNFRWTLAWLINSTGNFLLDESDESLASYEPLQWTDCDLDALLACQREALALHSRVEAGLAAFNEHPSIRQALSANLNRIHAHIRKKGLINATGFDPYTLAGLQWRHCGSPERAPVPLA